MVLELPEELKKMIDSKNFAFLATIMPDGSPQVTPVWIDREDDTIRVNTAVGRVKQRNVSRDPRVAIAIVDWNNPYKAYMIRGRVIEQTTDGADEHIDSLAKKYLGKEKYPWKGRETRVILKIAAERIAGR
ncbi:MAG: PPOX class F420-dependent oxidoreductase [Aigarchaeota archaeon]|nr:PPOX class F420-dependent oxidoreductase [Candidatus Pelearchaeum maunauluense]